MNSGPSQQVQNEKTHTLSFWAGRHHLGRAWSGRSVQKHLLEEVSLLPSAGSLCEPGIHSGRGHSLWDRHWLWGTKG